jgi:hypothetical protein
LLNGEAAPAQLSRKQTVKAVIEIPDGAGGSGSDVEEEDLAFFESQSRAGEFLQTLDKTAIARFVALKNTGLPSHLRSPGVKVKPIDYANWRMPTTEE